MNNVRTHYSSVHNPERANAVGLFKCVGDALNIFGVEAMDQDSVLVICLCLWGVVQMRLLSMCLELKGMMQQSLPWLYWSWCYYHRLELACKDGFLSPLYSMIQEMLSKRSLLKSLGTLNALLITSRGFSICQICLRVRIFQFIVKVPG